jgi:hypothetical protein
VTGAYIDQVRDLLIEAQIVPIEIAAEVPQLRLDADEITMLAGLRRLGWHAFRREADQAHTTGPDDSGPWVTLIHLADDRLGVQTIRRDGQALTDEAWFTLDEAGVAALAAALRR